MKNLVLQHSAAWDIVSKRFMYLPEHYKRATEKLVSFDNWSIWITLKKKLLLDKADTKSIIPFKSSYYAYPWQRVDLLCNLNVLLLLAVQSCKQFLVAKFG